MRLAILGGLLLTLVVGLAFQLDTTPEKPADAATEITWMTDYEAAVQKAAKENKKLLINFTGSDWCGWCIRLDREVFKKEAFVQYADENLVCVKLDFPRRKKLSQAEAQQNMQLARKHKVRGYPTILIMDGQENVLLRTGYQRGGADNYINHIDPYVAS